MITQYVERWEWYLLKVMGIEDIFDNTTVAKVCKQAVKTWKEL